MSGSTGPDASVGSGGAGTGSDGTAGSAGTTDSGGAGTGGGSGSGGAAGSSGTAGSSGAGGTDGTAGTGSTDQPLFIDPPERRLLGPSVDIDGDTAILGSLTSGVHDGAAYIARRGQNGKWSVVQKLTAGSRASSVYRFGEVVALSGDFALVGAWGDYASPQPLGAAFFFRRAVNGQFELFQFLEEPGPAPGDQFGGHTGISGARAIITERANARLSVQVHVYELEGGVNWTRTTTIRSPREDVDDFFGVADLESDTIVVGADNDDEAGAGAGAAYIFKLNPIAQRHTESNAAPDEDWSVVKKWLPPEPSGRACVALALSGNTVLCGAPLAFGGGGAVYAFSVGGDGVEVLRPPVDEQIAVKSFGWAVAIDGDTAAVAPDGTTSEEHGTAYIFRRIGGKWVHHRKIHTGTATMQIFPMGLAVDGPTVIATSPIETDSSYVFIVPLPGTG